MSRSWWWRTLLILLIVGYAVYYLVPSWIYFRLPVDRRNDAEVMAKATPKWAPKKHLNLGLDLQGGIELVMGVDADKAMRDKAVRLADDLKRLATDKKIPFKDIHAVQGQPQLELVGNSAAEAKALTEMATEQYTDVFKLLGTSDATQTLGFQEAWVTKQKDDTVEQAVKSLRNRIDKWGVSEAEIKRIRGSDGIQIQLPGEKDPERAKKLMGQTAQLEFKMADDDDRTLAKYEHELPKDIFYGLDGALPYVCSQDVVALGKFTAGKAPAGDEFGLQKIEKVMPDQKSPPCQVPYYRTITLHAKVEVTGDQLTDARVQVENEGGIAEAGGRVHAGQGGRRQVLRSHRGEHRQAAGHRARRHRRLGAGHPVAHRRQRADHAWAASSRRRRSTRRPRDLALVLKAGALPAPVRILEERTVGASLGPELIQQGHLRRAAGPLDRAGCSWSSTTGCPASSPTWRSALNGLLLLAAMAMFGSTLTLPGIAGLVLTLGMAVDANVLINERIREELRAGKTVARRGRRRLRQGLLDHRRRPRDGLRRRRRPLLHGLGTGEGLRGDPDDRPRRLDVHLHRRHPPIIDVAGPPEPERASGAPPPLERIAMNFHFLEILPNIPKVDFVSKRRLFVTVSLIINVAVLIWSLPFVHGLNFGVDFAGGTEIQVHFAETPRPRQGRRGLKAAGFDSETGAVVRPARGELATSSAWAASR